MSRSVSTPAVTPELWLWLWLWGGGLRYSRQIRPNSSTINYLHFPLTFCCSAAPQFCFFFKEKNCLGISHVRLLNRHKTPPIKSGCCVGNEDQPAPQTMVLGRLKTGL